MAKRYTDEFRRDAVRMATTSGLTRPQLASDLGVGLSTLNNWVQQHSLPLLGVSTRLPGNSRALHRNGPSGNMMT